MLVFSGTYLVLPVVSTPLSFSLHFSHFLHSQLPIILFLSLFFFTPIIVSLCTFLFLFSFLLPFPIFCTQLLSESPSPLLSLTLYICHDLCSLFLIYFDIILFLYQSFCHSISPLPFGFFHLIISSIAVIILVSLLPYFSSSFFTSFIFLSYPHLSFLSSSVFFYHLPLSLQLISDYLPTSL